MLIQELKQIEQDSRARSIPILGSVKGAWLLEKIREIKPKKILELGTANGYSGIILGSESAKLTTVEINPIIAREAENNFKKFKINAKVFTGDGVEFIKKLSSKKENCFDLIFIDFAKKDYIKVLEGCILLVKKNKFIIADNLSFENCSDYKTAVMNHPKLETEIIRIEDWLSISKKVAP